MKREWAEAILDQCRRYGVPFFLKQWSAFNPKKDVEYPPTLEGKVWHEFPVVAGATPTLPPTSPGTPPKSGKDPKRVAAAMKAWETIRAKKAASLVGSPGTASDPPLPSEEPPGAPLPAEAQRVLDGGTITVMDDGIASPQSPPQIYQDRTFSVPSPKSGERDVTLPMALQRSALEGIDFPMTKHLFWFEHERLMRLRQELVVSMVTIPSEEERRTTLKQIREIDRYDRTRPKIRKKTWTRFRRSDRVGRLPLIRELDGLLAGFFAVTGGVMVLDRYVEPCLWVEKRSDAFLLNLKGFVRIDGVEEELELLPRKKKA
jgi:hypothetical protein